jgi:oligopeptidase B
LNIDDFDPPVDSHQVEVPNYDSSLYEVRRLEALAEDGTKVPISMVYKKTTYAGPSVTPAPLLLYGYGSYGGRKDDSMRSLGSHQAA